MKKDEKPVQTEETDFIMPDKASMKEAQQTAGKVLEELDRESAYRRLDGIWGKVITAVLFLFTCFQLYTAIFGTFPAQQQRMIHLGFVILLGFWLYPATKKQSRSKMNLFDMFLGLGFAGISAYCVFGYGDLMGRSGAYTTLDLVIGALGILLIMEACRRIVGWPIVIISSCFILYAFFGNFMPGFLNHKGYSLSRVISHLFYNTEGIIGIPIGVCATYIFLFILFGSFLEQTGIGQLFIDLANSVAGFAAGGPAKVAVLTSALEGTVSGSSVSNTVGSGSFTIPLMKSLGYKPEFAAAVEATASTGGQIMPPIMGAAAFLIAETVGVPYIEVVKAAIIPAILYFAGVWIMVDLEARRLHLRGIPRDQLPKLGALLKNRGHLLLPLVTILFLMTSGYTPTFAAMGGVLTAAVVPFFSRHTRIPLKSVLTAMTNGARNIIGVACACAVAGTIVGVVTLTGIGLKLGSGLLSLAGDNIIVVLFFTMITSLVLGMGVPTTANYLITSTICAPIVMQLTIPGTDMLVPALAAHLFAFYFGILADVTPPVALASYAGAAIAKSNPFKTGVTSLKLAIAAFIVPYIFVLSPSMLLIDTTWYHVVQIILTSLIGMYGVGAAMIGYISTNLKWWERVLVGIGGILLIDPKLLTDILGIALIALVVVLQLMRKKKAEHEHLPDLA